MQGYHFTSDTLRNGEPLPPVGEWLEYTGNIVPCKSGLHMSEHPFDALQYAPGNLLHRVELAGELQSHGNPINKWVGSRRKILASVDATNLLREYARWCALQVVDLWDAPKVVREYLETGDESKRAVANTASCYAAAYSTIDLTAEYAACAAAYATTYQINGFTTKYTAYVAVFALADAAARNKTINKQRQKFAEMVNKVFHNSE